MAKKKTELEAAQEFIATCVRGLRDLETAAKKARFNFEWELDTLLFMHEEHPSLFSVETNRTLQWTAETCNAGLDITTFTLEGDKVPFFSEAKLYRLIGKDAARSVLARVEALLAKAQK